ncbi:periplasmic heavy metal sensor [bacterium]|nr:periplasmic heavy metal sensor [bacterium]
MTAAQRAILVTVIVAFLAGLAGIAVGRLIFAPERTPGIHEVLHDELQLAQAQDRQIETLERDFAARRRALEAEMRAANGELAAAMREEHEYGPRVTAAVERFHHAMGELQSETMEHMFAMRAVLNEEQRTRFDAIVAEALTDGRQ